MTALRLSRIAAGLALLALLLRALAPAGWMPAVAADGGVTIVVCTGSGPAEAKLNLGIPAKQGGGAKDAPCGFAGLGAPALPAAPAFALALALLFILAAGALPRPLPARLAVRWRNPPSHAPPAFA